MCDDSSFEHIEGIYSRAIPRTCPCIRITFRRASQTNTLPPQCCREITFILNHLIAMYRLLRYIAATLSHPHPPPPSSERGHPHNILKSFHSVDFNTPVFTTYAVIILILQYVRRYVHVRLPPPPPPPPPAIEGCVRTQSLNCQICWH